MDFSLNLHQSSWKNIYTIQKNTTVAKGRRNDLYKAITQAAGTHLARFGCYAWRNETGIFYCGSFAQDYARGNFKSNLQGRIHNYLQNHRTKKSGFKNTNLMVFENLNTILEQNDISLCVFVFDYLEINGEKVDYTSYCLDSNLVHTVEELLICSYRRNGECKWNRT